MIDFKGTDKPKELVPQGAHVAILYSIIELGTMEGEYAGQPTLKRKIRLSWELPEETREFDGVQKPMVIGKKYTASLYEQSKLRPIVVGMLGGLSEEQEENFDIKSLLGKACMVQVSHEEFNGRKYATVTSVTQLPKSMKAPKQFNPSVYLDYADGWNQEIYDSLPQWMKDAMAESQEMKSRMGKGGNYPTEDLNPADVPF